jgi:hypothetical protein
MRLSLPPPAVLLALLACGCSRSDGSVPAAGPEQARGAVQAPERAAGVPNPEERPPAPSARPREPERPLSAPPGNDPPPPPEPKAERLELTFVGDIIFGRYRDDGSFAAIVADPSFDAFAEIRTALASDVVVGNLETPVVEELPAASPMDTPYRFGGSRRMVRDHLRDFTVLSLANNHSFDLGVEGQLQSPRILAEEGIVPIGAARAEATPLHRVETHVAKGWRIGFIAVTTLLNVPSPTKGPRAPLVELEAMVETLLPLVERARADHDLVVVVVHWGDEYHRVPSPRQRDAARQLIDGGADLVIGHHPHVLQPIERHGEGLVAYSLGNFLFEHTTASPRLLGVLRTVWQRAPDGAAPVGSCLADVVLHAAVNERDPHPHPAPATGELAAQVRGRIVGGRRTRWQRIAGTEDLRLAPAPSCAASPAAPTAPGPR